MRPICISLTLLFLCSCYEPDRIDFSEVDGLSGDESEANSDLTADLEIATVNFQDTSPMVLQMNEVKNLKLSVTLSNGEVYSDIQSEFDAPGDSVDGRVLWFSNSNDVVSVSDDGTLTTMEEGVATIEANLGNKGASLDVVVIAPHVELVSLLFHDQLIEKSDEQPFDLTLDAVLSDGTVFSAISANDLRSAVDCDLNFSSIKGDVALITQSGSVTTVAEGNVALRVECGLLSDAMTLKVSGISDVENSTPDEEEIPDILDESVEMVPEVPDDSADYFLSSNDKYTLSYGKNGGFGGHLFPDIIFGVPYTGGTHVVSFGGGGSLLIELNNYIVVDGPGVDFTIFENAVHSDFYGIFAERAQVSVSEDGLVYYPFLCDADDPAQVYGGCAGVNEVNPLENPLNPEVSGGDSFDLADVGLVSAKYIRIVDLDTCTSDDPTYYTIDGDILCGVAGEQGFDLDAMAIINGINE